MQLVLVTPPVKEPLEVTEVRTRLGLPAAFTDEMIAALVTAAREQIDGKNGWLGRALITQTWKLILDRFPCGNIVVPLPPLQAILGIAYIDTDGVDQVLAPGDYVVSQAEPATIVPLHGKSWPNTRANAGAVEITFKAGYGTEGSSVPEAIRTAIALQVGHLRSLMGSNLFLARDRVDGLGEKQYIVSDVAGAVINRAADAFLQPFRVYL